jgi:hypothetical protein
LHLPSFDSAFYYHPFCASKSRKKISRGFTLKIKLFREEKAHWTFPENPPDLFNSNDGMDFFISTTGIRSSWSTGERLVLASDDS